MLVFQGFFKWNPAVSKDNYKKIYNEYDKLQKYNTVDISSFDEGYITEKDGKEYVVDYTPIISTLAIGFVLYTFIKYALELALRQLKLAFLQIIAPFIVVDYMLKPGDDETLKKWINTTVSTYLIIFMRVLTVWIIGLLAYYLRNGIPADLGGTTSVLMNSTDPLIKALIVLAAFAFLKDLPKMMSELTGYNFQENEAINGIMQQGLGVVKGLAMAKVTSGIAKEQLGKTAGLQVAGAGLSAGSAGITAHDNGANAKGITASAASSFGQNTNSVFGGISGVMHSASPFQGVGQAAGVSGYSGVVDHTAGGVRGYRTQAQDEALKQRKQEKKDAKHENAAVNNTINDLKNVSNNQNIFDATRNSFDTTKQINVAGTNGAQTTVSFQQYLADRANNHLATQTKDGAQAYQYKGETVNITTSDINSAMTEVYAARSDEQASKYGSDITEAEIGQVVDKAIQMKKGSIANKQAASGEGKATKV